jgi:hypothetical protein
MKLPFRRVVPPGYQGARLTLEGTSPLLMHSSEADTESALYRTFRMLSQKRGKSLEDDRRLAELEWRLGIYYDDETGPFIPADNIHELLRSAATKWRKGEDVKRSLVVPTYRIPLIYEGPRDVDELWDKGFRYTKLMANSGPKSGRVRRCRPCFDGWGLITELAFDNEDLDPDRLVAIVDRAQKYGLGDSRPLFGAFTASIEFTGEYRTPTTESAVKAVDGRDKRAHDAMVKRIKRT